MQQITFLCDLTDQRIRRYYTWQTERQFVSKHIFCSFVPSFVYPIEKIWTCKYVVQHLRSISVFFPVNQIAKRKWESSIHSIQFDHFKGNTLHSFINFFSFCGIEHVIEFTKHMYGNVYYYTTYE